MPQNFVLFDARENKGPWEEQPRKAAEQLTHTRWQSEQTLSIVNNQDG